MENKSTEQELQTALHKTDVGCSLSSSIINRLDRVGQLVDINEDGTEHIQNITFVKKRIEPMKLAFVKEDWKFSEDDICFFIETDIKADVFIHNKENWSKETYFASSFYNEQLLDLLPENQQFQKVK